MIVSQDAIVFAQGKARPLFLHAHHKLRAEPTGCVQASDATAFQKDPKERNTSLPRTRPRTPGNISMQPWTERIGNLEQLPQQEGRTLQHRVAAVNSQRWPPVTPPIREDALFISRASVRGD